MPSIAEPIQRHFIEAHLNYIADTDIRPQVWNEDFSRNVLPLEAVRARIENASALAAPPRLDVEGFELVRCPTRETALADGGPAVDRYREELGAFMQALVGADHLEMAGVAPVRRAVPVDEADVGRGFPVPFIHLDITPEGVDHMVGWAYGPPPQRRVRRRALFNMWRLLSPPPTELPLAVCDARSVAPEDIVAGDSHFLTDDFTIEGAFLRPSPDHRWFYYAAMTPDDLLIFKQFDSDPDAPRQVPHTAFRDETLDAPVEPRISIEARAIAYWFHDE